MTLLYVIIILTITIRWTTSKKTVNAFTYNDLKSNTTVIQTTNKRSLYKNFKEWDIPMPSDTLFRGMPIPNNETKWMKAKILASKGVLILLKKVRSKILNPNDLIQIDRPARWAHKIADFLLDKDKKWDPNMFSKKYHEEVDRALIVLAGHHKFKDNGFEGDEIISEIKEYSPRDMIDDMKLRSIPVPIVLLGFPEENTCWLGTYFLNRTLANLFNDGTMGGPLRKEKNEIYKILDHPNILAVFTHQHHNLSHHPKVLSLPCGVNDAKGLWNHLNFVHSKVTSRKDLHYRKQHLLLAASSSWGPRPMIIDCVKSKVGDSFYVLTEKLEASHYYDNLIKSYAVLAVPGLGYDTMRLWESLSLGAIPIIEKSVGLDKTLYKLPALLVDDFAIVTPALIRR